MTEKKINGFKISEFQKGYSADSPDVDWERARIALRAAIAAEPVERRRIISEYFAEHRSFNLHSPAEREILVARGQPRPKGDWSEVQVEDLAEMCARGVTQ